MDSLNVSISGGEPVSRAADALREAADSLPGDLFSAIEQETRKLIDLARAKVRAMPVHGTKHTGLRDEVAEGLGLSTTVSGDVQNLHISTSMPRDNMASIPRGMDGPEPGWFHPLFANRRHWYTQHGSYSWFGQTFEEGRAPIGDEIRRALEGARDRVAAAAR